MYGTSNNSKSGNSPSAVSKRKDFARIHGDSYRIDDEVECLALGDLEAQGLKDSGRSRNDDSIHVTKTWNVKTISSQEEL